MVNNINGDIVANNTAIQQQEIVGIKNKTGTANAYTKPADLVDESNISNEAMQLYQNDKDVQKYKGMVLDNFNINDSNSTIKDLVNSGKYQVSDDDLAQSMLGNSDLVNSLFGD